MDEKEIYMEYHLNEFARRCFRDTADGDYIGARLAFRALLLPQFLWAGLQAVEKYLKYILLQNRIEAKSMGHDLSRGLDKINRNAPFKLSLSAEVSAFIEHLDAFGCNRYFETMYHYNGMELVDLDRTVWELRRYCQPINETAKFPGGSERNLLEPNLKMILNAENHSPHKFRIIGGQLEKIIKDKKHPSRKSLIWQNLYFGGREKNSVMVQRRTGFSNSPLAKHPEMVDEVLKYVILSKNVVKDCRQMVRERNEQQAKQPRKRKKK